MEPGFLALVVITLLAAFVNGALGYGFSSLTVPVGLLFFANRVLNPATSTSFGLLGTWHTSDAPPTTFTLNGRSC